MSYLQKKFKFNYSQDKLLLINRSFLDPAKNDNNSNMIMNKILKISVTVVITNNNNSNNIFRYHRYHYHYHYPRLALTARLLFTIKYKLLENCDCNTIIYIVLKNMIEILFFITLKIHKN